MRVKSVAERVKKIKLPPFVFWLDGYKILKLSELKAVEGQKKHCGCLQIEGSLSVSDVEGDQHINVYTADATSCYETLKEALEAMRLQKLVQEKKSFEYKYNIYRNNKTTRINHLRDYPLFVLQHLGDEMKVEGEELATLKKENLKVSHYRLAHDEGGYEEIIKKVVDSKFPELADQGEDDED